MHEGVHCQYIDMSRRILLFALLFFTAVWLFLLFTRLTLDPGVIFWDDARKYSMLATHRSEDHTS